jgi:hypothetical protein
MWLAIVIGLAVLLAILILVVALQPADFRISRSMNMAAAPDKVFPEVNDFHCWDKWSPWAKLDPAMKTTFTGPAAGEGSTYAWSGNGKVGEGKMTITKSQPPQDVAIRLEFMRPFRVTHLAEFNFKPVGQGTTVSWIMTGKRNFLFKAFGLFMSMDKMLGSEFEKGLTQLKAIAENNKST